MAVTFLNGEVVKGFLLRARKHLEPCPCLCLLSAFFFGTLQVSSQPSMLLSEGVGGRGVCIGETCSLGLG